MDKKTLRKKIISQRDEMDFDVKESKDKMILNKFFDLDLIDKYDNIFCYVGFGSEIDTRQILKEVLNKGKNLYVPYIDTEAKKMCLCHITNLESDLERGHFGILEPKKNLRKPVNNDIIDLVISPGVAFTKEKDRMGYGGGYYDRFYAGLKSKPMVIALAYDFQVVPELPVDPFDIPVDMILTDKQMIK